MSNREKILLAIGEFKKACEDFEKYEESSQAYEDIQALKNTVPDLCLKLQNVLKKLDDTARALKE